ARTAHHHAAEERGARAVTRRPVVAVLGQRRHGEPRETHEPDQGRRDANRWFHAGPTPSVTGSTGDRSFQKRFTVEDTTANRTSPTSPNRASTWNIPLGP